MGAPHHPVEFTVHLEQDEDGAFIATVPSLPGCHTFGFSRQEALDRVKEAIELCLKDAEPARMTFVGDVQVTVGT